MSKYMDFPPEQRFIIEVWKWQTNKLEEYSRCGSYEEAERILELAKQEFRTGRIIEVRKMFTDQY